MMSKFLYCNSSSIVHFSTGFLTTVAIFWLASMELYQGSQMSVPNVLAADQSPTTAKFVTYDGSKFGFTIEYPENWKQTKDQLGVWFESPTDGTGNFRIESQPAPNGTLSELVQIKLLQSKESFKDLEVLSSNLTSLDGNPANRTDYQFKIEEPKFMGVDVFQYQAILISTIKGNNFYAVTYFSTPENFYLFLPIAQKMMSSLRLQ